MKGKLGPAAKNALLIGSMCSIAYLAVYVARNILGAVAPQMIAGGVCTTEFIGSLSSLYFITYAVGQLINGMIGDKIKAKYMIAVGLALAGVCNYLFSVLSEYKIACYLFYGITGFCLSMIYAPMTKVVAENTEPIYAVRCSLGYTFASFLGSPLAGILAALMVWKGVFTAGSLILLAMAMMSFLVFTSFEKKGLIQYGKIPPQKGSGSIRVLLRHRIVKFTLIAVLTGIVRTTVVFWLPTYLSQYLGYQEEISALIYTVATLAISATTFIAVFLYERTGRNMDRTVLISFVSAAVCFLIVYIIRQPVINIVFMVLAIMSSGGAATMLWSRYCPGLRDTGMVSSATGFLDFMSYMAASVSSTLFANAVSDIGWRNLILIWLSLMLLGVVISIPGKRARADA